MQLRFAGPFALVAVLLPLVSTVVADDVDDSRHVVSVETPADRPLATLVHLATLGAGPGAECSGIVASRKQDGLYWSINDSGNEPRIFPLLLNAGSEGEPATQTSEGIVIQGASNVDWEDIAVDTDGRLIVCDVGNNLNARRDLMLYIIEEPEPTAETAPIVERYRVRYPDQREFPAPQHQMNFDCEAVFAVGNTVHLLSKNRSDSLTSMYRLDDPDPDAENVLTYVGTFDSRGSVTGADSSADGMRLVVITYTSIWLFERDDVETPFFDARIYWTPYFALQTESVCFTENDTLFLVDEKFGTLYELPLSELLQVR